MLFRSILDSRKVPSRRRAWPCLVALEQLEDRMLLSAVSPAALPEQSLAAVNAFLKIESEFNDAQVDFLKAESSLLQNVGSKLAASTADYFYKLDGDLAQIDGDLIGSLMSGQAATGIDGLLLADVALPPGTAKYLENVLVPAVAQDLGLENKLIGELTNQPAQPEAAAAKGSPPIDSDLKLAEHTLNGVPALTANFAHIENDLIAADVADLGPALGLQGSPSPGPAGRLLQDLGVLSTDASPTENAGASTGSREMSAAVDAFLGVEDTLIAQQDELLRIENAFYKGSTMPSDSWRAHIHPNFTSQQAAVDYFLKVDADLVQLDDDLIGPPLAATANAAATTGGIDGLLLTLDLPADMLATIQSKIVPALQSDRTAILAMEQQLLQRPGQVQADAKSSGGTTKKGGTVTPVEHLSLNFTKISSTYSPLIQTDPQGLGPLVGGLLEDTLVLASAATPDGPDEEPIAS